MLVFNRQITSDIRGSEYSSFSLNEIMDAAILESRHHFRIKHVKILSTKLNII